VQRLATAALALGLLASAAAAQPNPTPVDDTFLVGYASAVLQREFSIGQAVVRARDGVLYVAAASLPPGPTAKLEQSLRAIPGVTAVQIVEDPDRMLSEAPAGAGAGGVAVQKGVAALPDRGVEALTQTELYQPRLADPRWPHFSAAYARYLSDPALGNVADVSFGNAFSLLRDDTPIGGRWEIGLQAGVFAIFDLDGDSFDLINADYLIGVPITWRGGPLAVQGRVYHQSSHLGDEFLLRGGADADSRVNLSYEVADLSVSYDVTPNLRVYGGGGYIFHREPADLKPWRVQAGFDWLSPDTWAEGAIRPVATFDLQSSEESDWNPDISARAGIQFENPVALGQRLQLMLQYYDGRSPNGQFYERDVRYLGLGAHVHF